MAYILTCQEACIHSGIKGRVCASRYLCQKPLCSKRCVMATAAFRAVDSAIEVLNTLVKSIQHSPEVSASILEPREAAAAAAVATPDYCRTNLTRSGSGKAACSDRDHCAAAGQMQRYHKHHCPRHSRTTTASGSTSDCLHAMSRKRARLQLEQAS